VHAGAVYGPLDEPGLGGMLSAVQRFRGHHVGNVVVGVFLSPFTSIYGIDHPYTNRQFLGKWSKIAHSLAPVCLVGAGILKISLVKRR